MRPWITHFVGPEEDKGFDVKKTSTAMESCDAVYRCLK